MPLKRRQWMLLPIVLVLCSCGEEEVGNRKVTTPVTGQVTVDGKVPSTPIKITCVPVAGIDTDNPSESWCMTSEDGKFALSTYEDGDGVPPGEYTLTFVWGTMNLVSMSYGGPDQLKGRYKDPKTSEFRFTATEGEPVDMGTIALTTK